MTTVGEALRGCERGALLSPDGALRLLLWRGWGEGPPLRAVGLNPSVADSEVDDPTLRRLVGFALREGRGGVLLANLWGERSTDPNALLGRPADLLRRREADVWLRVLARGGREEGLPVLVGWGAHRGASLLGRDEEVRTLLLEEGCALVCLGRTGGGAPRHPLYVRADAAFEEYR